MIGSMKGMVAVTATPTVDGLTTMVDFNQFRYPVDIDNGTRTESSYGNLE
jgi:hypothetical protein